MLVLFFNACPHQSRIARVLLTALCLFLCMNNQVLTKQNAGLPALFYDTAVQEEHYLLDFSYVGYAHSEQQPDTYV